MELHFTLHKRIVDFLTSLPNMHDIDSQRAFIYHAGLDPQLQDQISFGKPPAQFVLLLVSILIDYGRLKDGRNALEAVLETAKNYVGQDREAHCDILIQELRAIAKEPSQVFPKQADISGPTKKILILSANPKNTARLRLDEEVREIEEGLGRSKHRDQFTIQSKWAVRLRDLRRAMLDEEPQIVHFCGHGKEDGLMAEDEDGNAILVKPEVLAGLFELFKDQVKGVLLNTCYSQLQAEAINKHINYVIGMRRDIQDTMAIEFAVGFYDALGAGKSIEEAFKFGRNAIQAYNIPEQLIPILHKQSVPVPTQLTAEEYFDRGCENHNKGDWDVAIWNYTEAIHLDPQYSFAYNNRGAALQAKGDIEAAIKDFNQAIRLNPNSAEAYTNRGRLFQIKGEFNAAIKDCNEAIRLQPEFTEAYNGRGLVHLEKGDIDSAIRDFNVAIHLDSKRAVLYKNRGLALQKKGDLVGAIQDWEELIRLEPNISNYIFRGVTLSNNGYFDRAILDFDQALQLPLDDKIINEYIKTGRDEKDIKSFIYFQRGTANIGRKDYSSAADDFQKVVSLNEGTNDSEWTKFKAYIQELRRKARGK